MVSIKKLLAGISGSHGTLHTIIIIADVCEGLTVPQGLSSHIYKNQWVYIEEYLEKSKDRCKSHILDNHS